MEKNFYYCILFYTLFLMAAPLNSVAQQIKTNPVADLKDIKEILETISFDKISWKIQDNDNSVSSNYIIDDIDTYIKDWKPLDSSLGKELRSKKTVALIKKYRHRFDTTFQDFQKQSNYRFIYFRKVALPTHFGLINKTELSLLFSSVISKNIYNTLKLTSKQRAAEAISTLILPTLKVVSKNFSNSEIKYLGMSCVYGSKDFSDDEYNSTKGEFVSLIVPSSLLRKYVSSDISEEELIKASQIFISDRDMGFHEIKKTEIIIQ